MISAMLVAAQLACMTEALYYEGRSEGFRGMVTIGAVIHNRVLDPRWGDTVCDVIEEPHQFSYLPEGTQAGTLPMYEDEARRQAQRAAYSVLSASDGTPLLNNILYYHADYVIPQWNFDLLYESFTYGSHIFYEDRTNDY